MLPQDMIDGFRSTLLAGKYNLLFGSGISLESTNGAGNKLQSAKSLKECICAALGVEVSATSLARATKYLTPDQISLYLTDPYSKCTAHASLDPFTNYLWQRIFTFNIDDVIESLYDRSVQSKQQLLPVNFDEEMEPTPTKDRVQLVHLHGSVRKHAKYVFSISDYAAYSRSLNPWMHLLSEILSTESFIVSGTSLEEPDLEYYLSTRNRSTPKRTSGPSLLIDPYPTPLTERDCREHGFHLIKAKFSDFLEWLQKTIPFPPTVSDLIVPDISSVFDKNVSKPALLSFFSSFKSIQSTPQARGTLPTAYMNGGPITSQDLDRHIDIPRLDSDKIEARLNSHIRDLDAPKVLLVLDDAGTGKSTVIHRVARTMLAAGVPVFEVATHTKIDATSCSQVLSTCRLPILIVADNIANCAEQIADLLKIKDVAKNVFVLGADRNYRRTFLDVVFTDTEYLANRLRPLSIGETSQLIELYRSFGIAAALPAHRNPSTYAQILVSEPIAAAVCRILNNLTPLDGIADSLWSASDDTARMPYLAAAIAQHCDGRGLRYSMLQSIADSGTRIGPLFESEAALSLTDHPGNGDYSIPLNATIAEAILKRRARSQDPLIYDAFCRLSSTLAPYVTRHTIRQQTPETSLARRLFDIDSIVRPLLGAKTEDWFAFCQDRWQWNSRYWEQRALLVLRTDLKLALQYARNAVGVEEHSYSLNTLATILFEADRQGDGVDTRYFDEAFDCAIRALERERARSRISVHPYTTLFSSVLKCLEGGKTLSAAQWDEMHQWYPESKARFSRDPGLRPLINRLAIYLK